MNSLINQDSALVINKHLFSYSKSEKIEILVDALRLVSSDEDIKIRDLYTPDNCEEYGFSEGYHNLGQMLHFFADMLEE